MRWGARFRAAWVRSVLAGAVGVLMLGGVALAQTSVTANASTSATVSVAQNSKLGAILVGPNGHTLYYFKKDSTDHSACAGKCVGLWPALTAASGSVTGGAGVTGKLGVITGEAGSRQVTYNGVPLYYFAGDHAAGQTNGQGFLKIWYAATPSLTAATAFAAAAAPAAAPAPKTSASSSSTASSSSSLPKTGSNPLFEVLGGALVLAGAGLLLRRRRPGSQRAG